MAVTRLENEDPPLAYPTTTPPLANNDIVWQRIESYIDWRFTPRSVTWVVDGPGEWVPPLKPATVTSVEVWNDTDKIWISLPIDPSPLGFCLTGCGPYRFTATVGGNVAVPAIVWEAAKRLSAYMLAKNGTPGVRSESIHAGSIAITRTRDVMSIADAMRQSGAADLLRKFR